MLSSLQNSILILEQEVEEGYLTENKRKAILSLLSKSMIRVCYKDEKLLKKVLRLTEPILELEFEKVERLEREFEEKMAKQVAEQVEKQVAEQVEKRVEKQVAEQVEKQVAERQKELERESEENLERQIEELKMEFKRKLEEQRREWEENFIDRPIGKC